MIVSIHVDSMRAAEQLSLICKGVANELFLRSAQYCIDPKSTLGVLAMMYSARDDMKLDTGELREPDLSRFLRDLSPFLRREGAEAVAR